MIVIRFTLALIIVLVANSLSAAPEIRGFKAMEAAGEKYISRVTKGLEKYDSAFLQVQDIEDVNTKVNSLITYTPDDKLYGEPDHWASFEEISSSLAGDCEDYALLKYWALRKIGIPAEDMHVLIFYDKVLRLHHAVLIVNKDGEKVILDNRTNRLFRLNQLTDILPNMAINENEFFIYGMLKAPKE